MNEPGLQCPMSWKAVAFSATTPGLTAPYMEHRWGVRRACRARVCVSAGAGVAGIGRLRNISMSGAFLEFAHPLPLFSQVTVCMLREDGAGPAAEYAATVVRSDYGGVGLEWRETANGPVCRMIGCAINCAATHDH